MDARIVSLPASIDLDWADGSYHFALLLPELVELEEKCGYTDANGVRRKRGIIAIYGDLVAGLSVREGQIVANPMMGSASGYDAREVIRLALRGGGRGTVDGKPVVVDPPMALRLIQTYVDSRPIIERWTTAAAILKAAVEGFEPPKAAPAKAPARKRTRKSRSTSQA